MRSTSSIRCPKRALREGTKCEGPEKRDEDAEDDNEDGSTRATEGALMVLAEDEEEEDELAAMLWELDKRASRSARCECADLATTRSEDEDSPEVDASCSTRWSMDL